METETKRTPRSRARPVQVLPAANWVKASVMEIITGYTPKAMERKREEGVWVEGDQWVKAPDGNILYSIEGYTKWATSGQKLF